MSAVAQDVRFAFRMLWKSPSFAMVALATLAIGIGLNTAMFSVVYTVLIKRLPFADPDRLIVLYESDRSQNVTTGSVAAPNFLDWREQNKSLSGLAAYNDGTVTLTGSGTPRQIGVVLATPELFSVLEAKPLFGRAFLADEGQRGHDHVVVLSHRLWQQGFGSDRSVVGKTVQLDSEPYTVIGVMPASFQFPLSGTDVWIPLSFAPNVMTQRGAHYLATIGRLKDGITLPQAREDLEKIATQLSKQYPSTNQDASVTIKSYRDAVVGKVRNSLLVLLGAVGLVVLIACVNVANLLLARSVARERELAIRTALGGTRERIVRQLLTESLVMSGLGAGLGLMLAYGLQAGIARFGPKNVPLLEGLSLDFPVVLFTAALVVLTGLLFGTLPALRAAAADLHVAMRIGASNAPGGRRHRLLRHGLVVGELALSIMLLIGAGLLIRSFQRLSGVDPGFRSDGVLTFSISLPEARYNETPAINRFYDSLVARLRALPGVDSAGHVNMLPLGSFRFSSTLSVDRSGKDDAIAQVRVASDGYFETLGIPLLQGRLFTGADTQTSPRAVLIAASAAKRLFPNGDAIGHHVRFGARPGIERLEGNIVGVVGDVRALSLAQEPPPMFYVPASQAGNSFAFFVVRTRGAQEGMLSAIAQQVQAIDPEIPLADVMPLSSVVSDSVSDRRFYMFLLGLFAAIALLLAVVGVYGVISYSVTQRTQELGVRVALGARQGDILRLVLSEAMLMIAFGVGVGIAAAALLTRILASLLFGVRQNDPATIVTVSAALAACALFASYWPARRAMHVDPMVALREE